MALMGVIDHCPVAATWLNQTLTALEILMRHRALVLILALSASASLWAQEAGDLPVRQISTTQAHLREIAPQNTQPAAAGTHVLVRLMGKLLSEQFKDVRLELDGTLGSMQGDRLAQPSVVHFNRRAEICFDNYRVGLKKDGVALRYELRF